MRYCLKHNDAIESHEFEEYSLESVINMIKRSMTLINTGKYTDTFTSLKMLSLSCDVRIGSCNLSNYAS